ncbi:hypothetical protein M378DRAFT_67996 [Amanita muscaria Koide BX008]|uniref:Uncharacterized protein n=1 Tax=Amanita muscaria (strain Koide BX008) TaxID=946122 RepID=A0A0C2TSH0_AMAMK|nr:hypothetical protein M378DRAFT_67996 [Amanita muscaria Koide BX008]
MSSVSSSSTARPVQQTFTSQPQADSNSRLPVTPAVLRSIFASSRTPHEERSISRIAFFRFAGFLVSCFAIGLAAARNRGIRSAALFGGVV